MASNLFEPYEFCGIQLRNRIVRSATIENMSTADRLPDGELMALYKTMAKGRVGLIITSAVRPDRRWDLHPGSKNLCIDKDEAIAAFRQLTQAVHDNGGKIALQLGSLFRFAGDRVAASQPEGSSDCRELTAAEIKQTVNGYVLAAQRSLSAGFDALQINAAHAFPLAQFLSPAYNRRTDQYGGNTEKRVRMLCEMISGIKTQTGGKLPVFIKMNVMDFTENGITVDEAAAMVNAMAGQGLEAVEASGGGLGHSMSWLGPDNRKDWHEGYLRTYTKSLKSRVAIPVIMVGGLRSIDMLDEIVKNGEADLVAMSRPLIREPQLIRRWLEGDRTPATCTSCNGCMQQFKENKTVRCVAK